MAAAVAATQSSSVIGSFQQSATSFYSDTHTATDVRHDDVLLQLHADFAVVPALSHRLGFPTMEMPTWEQVVEYVHQFDYVKYSSVDHYQRELYAAIGRRYGETLRLWCEQRQQCTRCHAEFRWVTNIGQWRCFSHTGLPLDHTRKRWSCCAQRTDLPLERRYNGCIRCDHTTLDLQALADAYQPQPDMIRMPIILMDKLNVRPEALHHDCLMPWVPPRCIDPLTSAPPPPHSQCFMRHVLTDVVFAEESVRRASLGNHHQQQRLGHSYHSGERYCMISLSEPTIAGASLSSSFSYFDESRQAR